MKKIFLISILATFSSCQPEPSAEEVVNLNDQPLDPTLFAPKIGETLVYQQTSRQLQPDAALPLGKDDLTVIKSKRTQRYAGPIELHGLTFHRFTINYDDTAAPDLLLDYRANTLSVATQAQPDGSFIINQPPIPIAQKDMAVGTFWRWPPSAGGTSGFRIVSFEEVHVPAGSFDAYKVTYQGQQKGITSLKDYWFTPGVGIIKEESRTYQGNLLRALSTIELEKMIPPSSKENP